MSPIRDTAHGDEPRRRAGVTSTAASRALTVALERARVATVDSPEVERLALQLLAALGRARTRAAETRRAPQWLGVVKERLDADLNAPRVAELAALAQVHPVHLNRTFRRYCGASIGEYARLRRLAWAAQQLVETNDPIALIGYRAGFADQSHFTRAFRAAHGIAPGKYRRARG